MRDGNTNTMCKAMSDEEIRAFLTVSHSAADDQRRCRQIIGQLLYERDMARESLAFTSRVCEKKSEGINRLLAELGRDEPVAYQDTE